MKTNHLDTKRAIGYYRVSTKEQVEEGNSLSTQEKLCRGWASKNGYEIVEQFIEQGESAKTAERTELQNLMKFCSDKKNDISAIIIYKLDRLSRNTDDYSQLRLFFKKYGVEIKSISENFEDNPMGRFMENMMANVAQLDNDVRSERCAGGMKEAVRDGRYVWMAPVGYKNTKVLGKATIVQDEEMAPFVKETFETVAKGLYTVEEVRQMMEIRGLRLRNGKSLNKGYFYKILKNRLYMGWIDKFNESHKGVFEPVLSEELFQQVQHILKNKGHKKGKYKKDNDDFPLRRFVVSPYNEKLTGSWSTGRQGVRYPFYRLGSKGSNYKPKEFEKLFKAYIEEYAYKPELIKKLKERVEFHFGKATQDEQKDLKKAHARKEELDKQQNLLIKKNLEGFLSDSVLKQQLDLVEKEQTDIQIKISSINQEEQYNIDDAMKVVSHYLEKPSEVWEEAKIEKKLKLQWFQFPLGLSFNGEIFGTTQISCVHKAKSAFLQTDSTVVDPRRIELLTSGVQNRRSTK